MTEIDYGRLDALEAILGGRAAIQDAYLKGKSYGTPGSVALVNAPNAFTADADAHTPITISAHSATQSADRLVIADSGGNSNFRFREAGPLLAQIPSPGSTLMPNIGMFGHHDGILSNSVDQCWAMAIDNGNPDYPYRDWVLVKLDGTVTNYDSFYASHNGTGNDPTFSFGDTPAKPGYKLTVRGPTINSTAGTIPGTGLGGLRVWTVANQVGNVFALQGWQEQIGYERLFVDSHTSAGAWNLVMRAQSAIAQPVLTLRDMTGAVLAVKTVTLGTPAAPFTLTLPAELGGGTTASIPATATANIVRDAIFATPGISGLRVAVAGSAGGPYTITATTPGPIGAISITGGGAGAAVADTTAGVAEAETFQIRSDGAVQWAGDGSARLSRAAAGILSVTNHFAVAGRIGVGTGATAPAAMVDIEGGGSTATFKLATAAGGLLSMQSLTSATCQIFTGNNSDLAFGTNGITTPKFTILKGGGFTVGDANHFAFGTTTGTKLGTVGGAAGQKIGFFGATPVVQPLLATGASHTVDDVITAMQTLGLVRQS